MRSVDDHQLDEWKREGEVGYELDHPNCAQVYHYDEAVNPDDGKLRMSMEFIPNGEFFDLITSSVDLHPEHIRFYMK